MTPIKIRNLFLYMHERCGGDGWELCMLDGEASMGEEVNVVSHGGLENNGSSRHDVVGMMPANRNKLVRGAG